MKVKLDRVTVEAIEVEVPEKCPECGADLTDMEGAGRDTLKGHGYMGVAQTCTLDPDNDRLDWGDDTEDYYELQHVTGLECTACGATVAGDTV